MHSFSSLALLTISYSSHYLAPSQRMLKNGEGMSNEGRVQLGEGEGVGEGKTYEAAMQFTSRRGWGGGWGVQKTSEQVNPMAGPSHSLRDDPIAPFSLQPPSSYHPYSPNPSTTAVLLVPTPF